MDRRCEGCGVKMRHAERLRITPCVDGVRRALCEECALEEVSRMREDRRELNDIAISKEY